MYAVEDAMRAYAKKLGEDEEKWAIVGILHDFDYEMYPTIPDHPMKGSEILKEATSILRSLSGVEFLSIPGNHHTDKAAEALRYAENGRLNRALPVDGILK